MNYKILLFNNVSFDDFIIDKDGGVWSQICNQCIEKHEVKNGYLDSSGSGVCGVAGCKNQSEHYIDFSINEIKIQ